MCLCADYEIIEIETCLNIIYKLLKEYGANTDKKYFYLDLVLYFISKIT